MDWRDVVTAGERGDRDEGIAVVGLVVLDEQLVVDSRRTTTGVSQHRGRTVGRGRCGSSDRCGGGHDVAVVADRQAHDVDGAYRERRSHQLLGVGSAHGHRRESEHQKRLDAGLRTIPACHLPSGAGRGSRSGYVVRLPRDRQGISRGAIRFLYQGETTTCRPRAAGTQYVRKPKNGPSEDRTPNPLIKSESAE
jgi:hypothetical protein